MKYTVVTGASRGLGYCIAEACAKRGMNLLLISLPEEELQEKADGLATAYGIAVHAFEADLTDLEQLGEVMATINRDFQVDFLVNNAGFGGARPFDEASPSYLNDMMLLNIRALVLISHSLLPNLKHQGRGFILNIGSMASFGPMPFKTVYPASKAFVWSFSRGLHVELKGTGISVSVAHPGGMPTNAEVSHRIQQHGPLGRSTFMAPERVAEICVRQTLKRDSLIIPGFMNKVSWVMFQIIPIWLQLRLLRRTFMKEIRKSGQGPSEPLIPRVSLK
jgi:short-subunit dehydrogenase